MENGVGRENPFWMWYFTVFKYYWKHELQIVWANFWCITNVPKVSVIKQSSFVTLHSAGWSRLRGSCVSLGSSLRFRFWSVPHVSIPEPKTEGQTATLRMSSHGDKRKARAHVHLHRCVSFVISGLNHATRFGQWDVTRVRGRRSVMCPVGRHCFQCLVVSSGKSHPVGK